MLLRQLDSNLVLTRQKRKRASSPSASSPIQCPNNRYAATNLPGTPKWLHDRRYCLRGEMENRIKEQKRLFSDRTSCHEGRPNQFRLLLSGLAYVLPERLRSACLRGTRDVRAPVTTLRLSLLKIGAVVTRNTRRILIMMSSYYPDQVLYAKMMRKPLSA